MLYSKVMAYKDLTEEQKQRRRDYYREYHKRPHRKEPARRKAVVDQKRRRDKIRLLLLEAKNKPCTDCGIVLPPEVMDFDHVRGKKLINIAHATRAKGYLSWAKMKEEIAKCDIRCPNCHRLRHHRERVAARESVIW